MESMEALRDLLVPDIQGDIVDSHGTYYAKLREGSSESKLKRIDIYGVSKDSILIKLDEYDQPITLFKNDKGHYVASFFMLRVLTPLSRLSRPQNK